MLRALIIDDESYARKELITLLADHGNVKIVGSCANAMEAIKVINHERPHVLFLDIKMPVLDGFDLLGMIEEEIMPYVVFVTAFDEYALKSFEEKTLDYLLKPVDAERLALTIKKITAAVIENHPPYYQNLSLNRIPCSVGHKIKLINPEDIEYVHSDISGVHVVTAAGISYTELTLKVLESRGGLLRCHKQYLVNLRYVDEIIPLENGMAELKTRSGHTLPTSRRYLRKLKEAFGI
jgi:two-component system LytT family response regulator